MAFEERIFIVYDARALAIGPDEASVLSTGESLDEARDEMRHVGPGVVYSYRDDGQRLVDARHEYTHPKLLDRGKAGS